MRSHRLLCGLVAGIATLTLATSAHADVSLFSSSPVTVAEFTSLAASGETVVAGGLVTDVFREPAAGWASEGASAILVDPTLANGSASSVAIDGNTIVATMSGAEDVFTAVGGGWTGMVNPVARLVDAIGHPVSGGIIEGGTIAAFSSAHDAVDIFIEPAGGWSGTITPAAQLGFPAGVTPGSQLAISQATVFVGGSHATYAFAEPPRGWSGTVAASATLQRTGDVSASGASVLIDGALFTEPAGGWAGTVAPTGLVAPRVSGPVGGPLGSNEILSGQYVVTAQQHASSGGCDGEHPCHTDFRAATEPDRGWAGRRRLQQFAVDDSSEGDPIALAVSGTDLFETDDDIVSVRTLPASAGSALVAPSRLAAHATGFAGGTPSLRLGVRNRAGQPGITALTIALPRGVSFATRPGVLAHGVALQGIRPRRSLSDGELTLTIPPGSGRTLHLSLGDGALRLAPALARRLRAGRPSTVRVVLTATTALTAWDLAFRVHV